MTDREVDALEDLERRVRARADELCAASLTLRALRTACWVLWGVFLGAGANLVCTGAHIEDPAGAFAACWAGAGCLGYALACGPFGTLAKPEE